MASIPDPSLDAGLAALNQGDYSVAIAHLEGVREVELDETIVSRASVGLVNAYRGIGEIESAIALCQQLTQDPDTKISDWAARTLPELIESERLQFQTSNRQAATSSDSTGFVAFGQTPSKTQTRQKTTPSTIKQKILNSTKRLFSNTKTQDSTQTPENTSRLPSRYSPPPTPHPSIFIPRPRWRNSGRAENLSPLKPVKLFRLWFAQIATAIALFWFTLFFLRFLMGTTNTILTFLPIVHPIPIFYRDPTQALASLLLFLLLLAPWLNDWLLKKFHGLQLLSLTQLAQSSPEATQVIQRFCRQKKLPLPKLGILPTLAPIAMTYGNLPRTARIVVSEGLLSQLNDDEIATIYASQLAHIFHWDFIWMSVGVLLIQIPYTIYWQVASWGEKFPELLERRLRSSRQFLVPLVQGITGVIASFSYGCYWCLRLPLLWLSKVRLYYSDRLAVETTGNPNGMTRALVKMALGITEDIQTYRTTSGLLESFDLLLPVGYRQAIILGSCSPQTPFETVLTWDCTNPYRDFLIVSASHPLMGERLSIFARLAQYWKLDPELDLPAIAPPIRDNAARLTKLINSYKALPLLQSALLSGLLLGIFLRAFLWMLGQIGDRLNIWQLIWMHNANPFLLACVMAAFSISVFLLINKYFPDLKPSHVQNEPNLGIVFANPATLPPDSQPMQLSGKLLGRRGLFNWLGQDLILQTSTGLVKLYFWSFLGPFGNLLPFSLRPSSLVEQQVTVTGWFRRGVTPWIDIETLRTKEGKVSKANYPIWITILALVAAVWGAFLIWEA